MNFKDKSFQEIELETIILSISLKLIKHAPIWAHNFFET